MEELLMVEYIIEIDSNVAEELKDSLDTEAILKFDKGEPVYNLSEFLVGNFNGFKVEIFSNEHPPPHFRIKYQGMTGNFSISTCEVLKCDDGLARYNKN